MTTNFMQMALTTSYQQVLAPNPDRVALLVCGDAAHAYDIWFGGPSLGNTGIGLSASAPRVLFERKVLGDGITLSVWALTSTANAVLSILESME